MNILVILGGNSSERDISLLSGKNIGESLQAAGHSVLYFDPQISKITIEEALYDIDVVFPMLHGKEGEDGEIQKILERSGTPFVGSSSTVSETCFDKWQTIKKLPNILFPKTEVVTKETINNSELIKHPFVLKPKKEGSSIDTFIVRDPELFDFSIIKNVFDRHEGELLLEEYIDGIELTVGIVEDTVLPVVEIIPPTGEEFDYENKYNGMTQENCPPKKLSHSIQIEAQNVAKQIHDMLGCRDYSRTDFIASSSGSLYTLEINTIPGMTKQSLIPKAAAVAGISMSQLSCNLVNAAFLRKC